MGNFFLMDTKGDLTISFRCSPENSLVLSFYMQSKLCVTFLSSFNFVLQYPSLQATFYVAASRIGDGVQSKQAVCHDLTYLAV